MSQKRAQHTGSKQAPASASSEQRIAETPRVPLRWALPFLAALTYGCSNLPSARTASATGWLEVTTHHFHLQTSLPEREALETVKYLETTRSAMLLAAWGGSDGPPGRSEVVVFARGTQFDSFVDSYIAGETLSLPGFERWLVFSRNTSLGVPSIAAHELAHDITSWYMPIQPPWLSEGLAQYLETVRYGKKSNNIYLGAPPQQATTYLAKHSAFDTATLLGLHSRLEAGYSARNDLYAQSWLLVRYLIQEQSTGFAEFQRRLAALTDWKTAFDGSMPAELTPGPNLDRLLTEYWASRNDWIFSTTTPMWPDEIQTRVKPVPPAAVHGLFAWLLAPHNEERARQEVEQALALDSTELNALRTSFYILAKSDAERQDLARRAVAGNSDRAEAWVMAADAAPTRSKEQSAALEMAAKLAPENPRVRARRGVQALWAEDYRAALNELHFALRQARPTSQTLVGYVVALGRNRRCEEARQIAENQMFSEELRKELRRTYDSLGEQCASEAKTPKL